uniref:Uncharacterized protein n=1 Tax=Zea mays TaxID=4577 RepID=C4IYJ0_MAIZE|nr:unknown [Zea mays]
MISCACGRPGTGRRRGAGGRGPANHPRARLPSLYIFWGRTDVRTRAGRRGIGGKGWSAAARIFERFGGGERMERKKARTHCTQAGTHAQRPDDNATVYVCVWRGEEDDGKGKSRQAAC